MAHNVKIAALSANAILDAIGARCNGGTLKIYTGTQPATGDASIGSATLLATCTFSGTAFAAASGGVMVANAITKDSDADNTGTAAWFRALTSGAAPVFDGTVGVGGSFDCDVPGTGVVQHQELEISGLTLRTG